MAQDKFCCLWHELGGGGEAVVGAGVGQVVVEVLKRALAGNNSLSRDRDTTQ